MSQRGTSSRHAHHLSLVSIVTWWQQYGVAIAASQDYLAAQKAERVWDFKDVLFFQMYAVIFLITLAVFYGIRRLFPLHIVVFPIVWIKWQQSSKINELFCAVVALVCYACACLTALVQFSTCFVTQTSYGGIAWHSPRCLTCKEHHKSRLLQSGKCFTKYKSFPKEEITSSPFSIIVRFVPSSRSS